MKTTTRTAAAIAAANALDLAGHEVPLHVAQDVADAILNAQLRPPIEKLDPADVEALAVLLCSFQVGLWRNGRHVQQGTPASWWRPQDEEVKQFYREQAEYALTGLRNRS